jgi:protoheme IX farnesyltransferase
MSDSLVRISPGGVSLAGRIRQFYALTKPRVVQLIVFCAVIGMLLASPGWPDWKTVVAATAGIWLVRAAAAAFNCLVEQRIDARMKRTAWRPSATGELAPSSTLLLSRCSSCRQPAALRRRQSTDDVAHLRHLRRLCRRLHRSAEAADAAEHRHRRGLGAMPPVLGWAAMRGEVGPEACMMFLIIFLWTPPHFWALALYRAEDYRQAGLPMLPITHGSQFTRLHVLLYTLVLFAATLLPYTYGMSGGLYLGAALVLGAWFTAYAWRLWRVYSDALARRTFASRSCTWLRCSPRCWSIIPGDAMVNLGRRTCVVGGVAMLAGCDRVGSPASGPSFRATDVTGAGFGRQLALPDIDGRMRSLGEFKGRWWCCSSATPSARTYARPPCSNSQRSRRRSARTVTASRACSSRSTRSATPLRC